ncbi:MAG: hypothetical protein EAX95_14175 [Candidatus Thorarchaeota archaeon]|nr:hypothetical protein [Candidatus Thorarchaeota archaeon]
MRPPCELVQREFLPLVRASLAKRMSQEGISQIDIARKMNITQAAVSKYLRQPLEPSALSKEAEVLSESLRRLIVEDDEGSDALVKKICSVCMISRIGSSICDLHRERVPSLGETSCRICTDLLGRAEPLFTERAAILQDIEEAMAILSETPRFAEIVPQVRANLVACTADAKSLSEVAGIPGRITVVGGRARSAELPQFGASTHTATLLLWAKKALPDTKACLCISGTDVVVAGAEKVIRPLKTEVIRISQSGGDAQSISKAIEVQMKGKYPSTSQLAIHIPGGIGIEPILYIFGASAVDLARLAEKISDAI